MKRFDQTEFRHALGKFATGITVVTTHGRDQQAVGITVNSFTSVSLDPPLVLWCLDLGANTYEDFANCKDFAIHVLHEEQENVSRIFAENDSDKFSSLEWHQGELGSPVLTDCSVCLQCSTYEIYPGGDHIIILGRVEIIESFKNTQPLIYHGGTYRCLNDE